MSPTSTEPPRSDARFRRALALTLAGLLVACLALVAIGYLQGPKLDEAQIDLDAVTSADGQQLRLFANQAVAEVDPSQVTIEPATEISVTTKGDVIAVQFGERLRYGTEYHVRVTDVTSVYLAQPSTIDYRFTTAFPQLLWLDRGQPDDAILRSTLDGQGGEAVYSAPGIQDFVLADDVLAVVHLRSDRTSGLGLVRPGMPEVEELLLPEPGVVQRLDATGAVVGFTLTSAEPGPGQANSSTLYTVDLDAAKTVTPVLGLDGEPIRVMGWGFVPGSSSIVALTHDGTLLLVDARAGTILPLGQYSEFGSIALDGSSVIVSTLVGQVILDLVDGTEREVEPSPIDGQEPFTGASQVMPDGSRVGKALLGNEEGTRFITLLVRDDGTESAILYRTPRDRGSIGDFEISPNGQYVAIETIPDTTVSVSDGYYFDSRSTSVTTVIVDTTTGEQVRSFEGFGLVWD